MGISGPLCAIQAGCCAALASVSAKLAVSATTASAIADNAHTYLSGYQSKAETETQLVLLVRVAGVAGIFLFNALMWVLFTKSMHLCSSTLEATAFNTAANFILTAVVGQVFLEEQLNLQWYLGSSLLVCGLILLHKGSERQQSEKMTKQKVS